MPERYLVCEGSKDSIDTRVLRAILQDCLGVDIVVRPCGGRDGLPAVAAHLRAAEGVRVATVADRDYRSRESAEDSYVDGKPNFIWRRNEIENYLLEPEVVVRALTALKDSLAALPAGAPAWADGLPDSPDQVSEALRSLAQRRAACEAARMTIEQMWSTIRSEHRVQMQRPDELRTCTPELTTEQCREAALAEAARVAGAAQGLAASPGLASADVGSMYDEKLAETTASTYLAAGEHLVDFKGRELLVGLHDWLRSERGASGLGWALLTDELVEALPIAYAEVADLYDPDDFRDLANGLRPV